MKRMKLVAKILVIEDNSDINQMLKELLEEASHEAVPAFSGTEGLLLFQQHPVDLVLLDIMLPGKSGGEVLAEIRQHSNVPIIMITALGDKKLISEYLLKGANDYITKPFDLSEVLARVTVQLRNIQEKPLPSSKKGYKNITLDGDTFEISSGAKAIRLGRIDYEILNLLLSNPKRIYTKEQLFELIWHESYISGDNTLNAHLSNLRKKLAQLDPDNEYIETIWGLGVRLAAE